MKIIKKVVAVLLCVSILMAGICEKVYASEPNEVYTAGYECIIQDGNVLRVSSEGSILAVMEYDEEGYRISKDGISSCEYVYEEGRLIKEIRDGLIINYTYGYDTLGNIRMVGFVIDNAEYTFLYGEGNMVTGIMDSNEAELVKYDYNGIDCINVLRYDNGKWISETDSDFIGNYNRIRCYGVYWDEEMNWYYDNHVYSDCTNGKVIGLQDNADILTDYNPFISGLNEGIMLLAYADVDEEVEAWADSLLSNSSYNGTRIATDVDSLSAVEVTARMIYAENTSNLTDQTAIAWVVMNRMSNSSRFASTVSGVVRQYILNEYGEREYEFVSIIGEEALKSKYSWDMGWRYATYLACLLCTTTDTSCWNELAPKPVGISNQTYFCSARKIKNKYLIMHNNVLTLVSEEDSTKRVPILNACIAGKGTATTDTALAALCGYDYSKYNVFYYLVD